VLADPQDRVLARAILSTDDPAAIAARVEDLVAENLDGIITGCGLFTQSVGAVFVLGLDDGRRVVLKAHGLGSGGQRSLSFDELQAVYTAQERLASVVPCARVLMAPRRWHGGAAAFISFIDAPIADDPHEPAARRAMARGLAEMSAAMERLALPLPTSRLPPEALFPAPHNALFDFSTPGGDWIDARARDARAVLDQVPERLAALHTDFSAANVLTQAGRLTAVFDMDSVGLIDEMRCLASTAIHFTYRGDPPWRWPTRDEARAFVADYVAARGRPLDRDEARRLDAAAIYGCAYTARCELSLNKPETPMGDLLRDAHGDYLSG
jgi:hypothetical protein